MTAEPPLAVAIEHVRRVLAGVNGIPAAFCVLIIAALQVAGRLPQGGASWLTIAFMALASDRETPSAG